MSRCFKCARYKGDLSCEAFPQGIPEAIITGKVDHDSPVDGDGGKVYKRVAMSNFQEALKKAMERNG